MKGGAKRNGRSLAVITRRQSRDEKWKILGVETVKKDPIPIIQILSPDAVRLLVDNDDCAL
jgi:hypothetical protein